MKNFGGWFRRLGEKLSAGLRHFMAGRYGTDKLNSAILWIGVAACLLTLFIKIPLISLLLTLLSYILMGIAVFRTLSRNTYKRYQENRKFLNLLQRIKDREHRYFSCPGASKLSAFPGERARFPSAVPNAMRSSSKKPN